MAISNSNNSFQLNCFMLGDKHFNPYPLEVSSNWTLQKLEDNITQRHERIMHQTLINVRLYQIDSTIEELPNLSPEEDLKLMRRMHRVREYWPHPEQVDWHRVHVVVVADDIVAIPPAVVPPPTADQNQSNTPTADVQVGEIIQRFKNARLQYSASVKLCSASTAAKPTEFAKQQKGNNYMLNGRPRQHTGPAIVLYHPVFGNFLSNLQSSDSLPPKFYERIFDYFWTSQEVYDVEMGGSRGSTSRDVSTRLGLEDLLDKLWKISEPGAPPDAAAVGSGSTYCLILEMKNEIDAIFFNCPIVQPLTDFIWVGINPSKPGEVPFVARVFHSILKARRGLEAYYANLTSPATLENTPAPSVPLPYLTHFIDDDGQQVEFTYTIHVNIMSVEPASHLKRSRSQFTPDKHFVERYNVDAHKLLAKEGLAPKLLYDGTMHTNDQLGPDYSMIVMEYVYGFDLGYYAGLSVPSCVSDDLDRALSLLHAQDLVFGDLQPPNVMLAMDRDGKVTGAQLIDFDWCGKHQVDRYPFDMNKNIHWASGVGPGALLDKRHDIEMRKNLPV